jgi:hypothetical protein
MSSYILFELMEVVSDRRRGGRSDHEEWPWYFGAHDGTGLPRPTASNCFDPRAVLRSVQDLERNVRRYERTLRARWEFSWLADDGQRAKAESLPIIYRNRNCRLFGDADGVWAVETDPGPRQGIHHELGRPLELTVQQPDRPSTIVVAIRRISLVEDAGKDLAAFRALCARAMKQKALLLTSKG